MAITSEAVLARNAVRVRGSGPKVVLIHGYGCDQSMWDAMIESLGPGLQVITYDLTGMGSSDYHDYDLVRHGTLRGHAEDLIEIIEAVGGPVHAVGHSVSSMVAGLAAAERPDLFTDLVMLCPSPYYINDGEYMGGFERSDIEAMVEAANQNYLGWAGQLASLVAGKGHRATDASLEARFCKNDPLISHHFAQVTFNSDNRSDLHRIPHKTLIIDVRQDTIAPPQVIEFMLEQMPDAAHTTIDSTGHAPHMTHPAATAKLVREFLDGSDRS